MKSRSIIKVLLLAFGIGAWVFLTAYILPVSFAMFKMFERLWPITSIKARGTAIYYSSEGKISYPLNLILESPNKYRLEIETPEGLRVEIQKGKHFSISHNKRVVKRGKRKEHLLPFLFTRSAGTAASD